MAHNLSQEQVLDIRARLFCDNGRVTVASMRDALRVVGQDDISTDDLLRLLGVDPAAAAAGAATVAAGASAAEEKRRRRKQRRQRRRESGEKLQTAVSFFFTREHSSSGSSSGSDSTAGASDESDADARHPRAPDSAAAAAASDDSRILPTAVDFPQFLQRLNRLVQDRETVRELRQLFFVLARFAHERRMRAMDAATAAAASVARAKDGDAAKAGSAAPGAATNLQALLHLGGGAGAGVVADDAALSASDDARELERFLLIRPAVDAQPTTLTAAAAAASASAGAAVSASASPRFARAQSSIPAAGGAAGSGGLARGVSFHTPEELQLLASPHVLTREELRVVLAEVLEATARKSTGIDHVMGGLAESENFITCDRFVGLILRGGPEVVALPFLL
jgi:hypothetical protein